MYNCKVFLGFKFVDLQNNALFVSYGYVHLITWNAIVALSEQCVEKFVHVVFATLLQ